MGAVELSRDRKSCHRSRHVDRRYFKVRELQSEGVLKVIHVPTESNRADIMTKSLDTDAFLRHRDALMGAPPIVGEGGVERGAGGAAVS